MSYLHASQSAQKAYDLRERAGILADKIHSLKRSNVRRRQTDIRVALMEITAAKLTREAIALESWINA